MSPILVFIDARGDTDADNSVLDADPKREKKKKRKLETEVAADHTAAIVDAERGCP